MCIAFEDSNIIKNCCIFNRFLFEIGSENWVVEIWSNVLHLLHVNHFITWNSRQMRTFYPAFYLLVRIHYIHINTHAPVVHVPFFMSNHLIIYVYISDHYFRAHIFYEIIRIMRKYYVPKFHEIFYLILYMIRSMWYHIYKFTLSFELFWFTVINDLPYHRIVVSDMRIYVVSMSSAKEVAVLPLNPLIMTFCKILTA